MLLNMSIDYCYIVVTTKQPIVDYHKKKIVTTTALAKLCSSAYRPNYFLNTT
jgi:hypothetical protein